MITLHRTVLRLFLLLSAMIPGLFNNPAMGAEVPVIAAASDLKFALEDIARQFTKENGRTVKLSFGSSGNFFRQISQNAPFELFMSADEQYVFDLAKQGLTVDQGSLYAIGRVVLFTPNGSPLIPDADLKGLSDMLQKGRIKRFAIANPEHAPYGRAAKEVLIAAGLWDALQDKLVLGETVAQAAQYAVSGSAQGGIIAYSLALSPKIKAQGNFVLLPEKLHKPLRQRMVLLKQAGETANAFHDYLLKPEARAVFEHYGFVLRQ
ncbi:MAG: molybdate ABC transporter substrate-binding protein [Methylococcales bacterium]|nr:molybdate ABC transporter substrate-binding protein [Methylococcales bacterium]